MQKGKEEMSKEPLFVYGSLKRGYPNSWILGPIQHEEAETKAGYEIYNVGGFPGMIRAHHPFSSSSTVKGEVVEVEWELLMRLDRFEGHPTFYRREKIKLKSGKKVWAYMWRGDKESLGVKMEGGKW